LKRRGFSAERIAAIKRAYKLLYRNSLTLEEAKVAIKGQGGDNDDIALLLNFLNTASRGIIR
jgi:UDP-N-acetylglucosamine acyltransferase